MPKTHVATLMLTLALVLSGAAAAMAQDESPAPETSPDAAGSAETFDPASVPEFDQDEALIAYALFREELLAMGVAEEDLGEATAYLEGEFQSLSPEEVERLATEEMTDEAAEVEGEVSEAEQEIQDEKDEAKEEVEEVKEQVSD